jgi:hypothetical protein
MSRISIEGLNDRQCKLMDAIWSMESYDEVMAFRTTLHPLMRRELDVLLELLRYEALEPEIQAMRIFPDAMRAINKIKKRFNDI